MTANVARQEGPRKLFSPGSNLLSGLDCGCAATAFKAAALLPQSTSVPGSSIVLHGFPLMGMALEGLEMKAIEQMTQEEKLQAIEALWDSLWPRQELVPSPEWHGSILQERAERATSGQAAFSDWEAAKKRLSGQS